MKKKYFFLEPYVHVSLKREHALIYNTLNGKILEYNQPEISAFLKRVVSKQNLYVIKLFKRDLESPVITSLIKKTRQYFMGDLLVTSHLTAKPVQVIPGLKVLYEVKKISNGNKTSLLGGDLMSNLREISIYINKGNQSHFCDSGVFDKAYKQFLSPWCGGNKKKELPFEDIKKIIWETGNSNLFRINILGGDIFSYSKFHQMTQFLNEQIVIKSYYVHYSTLKNGKEKLSSLQGDDIEKKKSKYKWELNVFVSFPVLEEEFARAKLVLDESGINTKFHLIVRSEKELQLAEKLIAHFKLPNYIFHPFFDGKNLAFFKKQVFMNREEIVSARPTQKEILIRGMFNQTNFGKLTVLSNGTIYANLNRLAIGNIREDSINDIILKELCEGRSWKRTRSALKPCKGCTFQYLCPSPSNYEYVIGKNNLCIKNPGRYQKTWK